MSVDEWLDFAIGFLNGDPHNLAGRAGEYVEPRHLHSLVKGLQGLEALISNTQERGKDAEAGLRLFTRGVNNLLGRYTARPFFVPVHDGRPLRDWSINWLPVGGKKIGGKKPEAYLELYIVLQIIEIARAGRISAFKQCDDCQTWYFAKFSHQRFCSADCKEHFHRSNEADKKRRREWARKNYWIQKHTNVK